MKPETMRLVTLAIAILALVVSSAALVWQIASWRRTGSFVKVENRGGFTMHPVGMSPGLPPGKFLRITARNVGRAPVDVEGWWFEVKGSDDAFVTPIQAWWQGPALPYRLDAGQSQAWWIHEEGLLDAVKDGAVVRVSGAVSLGTGKKRKARHRWGRRHWLVLERPPES